MAGVFEYPEDLPVTAGQVRAELAGATGQVSDLEREILRREIENRLVGEVEYGKTPHWMAGGAFGPKDLFNATGIALGGLAGAVGAGARGLAHYATRQSAVEAVREPVEQLFLGAGPAIAQAGRASGKLLAGMATGAVGALGLGSLYGYLTDKPVPPPNNAGVGVSVPAAVRTIKSRADRIEAATDATVMTPAQFKAKWGGLPEEVIKQ